MSKSKLKKWHISIIVIASVVAVFCVAVLGIFIHETIIWNGGDTYYDGEVPEYTWDATDNFELEQYPSITTEDGNAKVLQLTDLHFRNGGTFGAKVGVNYITDGFMYDQVKRLVKAEEPDLIVLTGDQITFANAVYAYEKLAEFFGGLGVPWTLTFGNHDAEYNAGKARLSEVLMNAENCLYQPGPTNLTGLGHHVVRVNDKDGNLSQALVLMDSNDYIVGSGGDKGFNYSTETAGFYQNQVDWYRWVIAGLDNEYKRVSGDTKNIQTSLYCHINFSDKAPEELEDRGEGPEELNQYGFRNAMAELKSTRFVFFGHTHADGRTFVSSDGLVMTNGVKAGMNYHESSMTGGTMAYLNVGENSRIKHIHDGMFGSKIEVNIYVSPLQ